MKKLFVFLLAACLLLALASCGGKYDEADFLGKTSAEIEASFGPFDCVGKPADADGLYKSTGCGYTVREARVGFFGTDPEVLLFISFDENGVAVNTYEGYRPGG